MFMDRKFLLVLALVGTILAVVAIELLSLPLGLGNGANNPENISGWGLLVYIVGVFGGGTLVIAAAVMALIQTGQRRRWAWFGVILTEGILALVLAGVIVFYAPWALLVVSLTLVIYGVIGPDTPIVKHG
jgi:hypothetical protein